MNLSYVVDIQPSEVVTRRPHIRDVRFNHPNRLIYAFSGFPIAAEVNNGLEFHFQLLRMFCWGGLWAGLIIRKVVLEVFIISSK